MTGTYCKNEYKLIRKQCMMVLWKLMVCLPAEGLRARELILIANRSSLRWPPSPPPNSLFFTLGLLLCVFLFPLSFSVSPAVPYHSPVELTTEPTVSLSFMAGVMKHWCNGCGNPLVTHPEVLNLCCNKGVVLCHIICTHSSSGLF